MAARMAISSSFSRVSSSFSARLTPRRSLAAAVDHNGPAKVNIWEDPMSPSKWKEEHFVLASLSGWFVLVYGASKIFGGKKEEVIVAPAS